MIPDEKEDVRGGQIMGYFPFYMDIEGKLCVIAGGGKVAYRKVCDLLPFGATIKVSFPGMAMPGYPLWRGTVLWGSRLKLIQTAFSVDG